MQTRQSWTAGRGNSINKIRFEVLEDYTGLDTNFVFGYRLSNFGYLYVIDKGKNNFFDQGRKVWGFKNNKYKFWKKIFGLDFHLEKNLQPKLSKIL